MRTLGELLEGLVDEERLSPLRDRTVSGVFDDSRRIEPGGLFVAIKGTRDDGRRYAEDAVRRGAGAIIGEDVAGLSGAAVISVPDARATLARLAARWFDLESAPANAGLQLVGVTGTNGKSTTAFMTSAILLAAGRRCGLIGTVRYDLGTRSITSGMTTPGPLDLARYLRECADSGADSAVVEVSSHALDQKRTEGLRFAAAAFTNLTGDHLDYHGDVEQYRDAKARLFRRLDEAATAVVNRDDPAHVHMLEGCRARQVRYSLNQKAEISARITHEAIIGTRYVLSVAGSDLGLENAIVGRHNVYNAMAAAGLALALGASPDDVVRGLGQVRNVPGRLQRVPVNAEFDVFVDYAHTDDALRNVLSVLKPLTRGRLIVVFGCGGDRDRTKRPRMGAVVAELADAAVVTSDNPRGEPPRTIIEEVVAGIDAAGRRRVMIEPDRRRAILTAMAGAKAGDVVLIAGKGHEDYQEIGGKRVHFDDVEVAIEAMAELAA
jgi:UDP-N-acetylmuramoyl-L-alanyl-D-glutamate--2,6-diaminopimelate ligase